VKFLSLAFKMAQSVQGWRQKWFYIKDQKFYDFDQYGLALFDASKRLTKLTTWDALPSDAEVDNIKPLLARIQELKNVAGNGLNGTHLMVFFLHKRIQPLQARVSKLWTYSGSNDPSRVSSRDPEKKDLDKRVRSLTTLTAKDQVPMCLAAAFDPMHPLPQVHDLQSEEILLSLFSFNYVLLTRCTSHSLYDHQFLASCPPLPKEGPINAEVALLTPKPPRLVRTRTGMEPRVIWREVTSLCRLLSPSLKLKVQRRNGNA
jgi:hypothetical protein